MERVILHCDCNSFFASVEVALNPALKNVPMAVCGSVEARHGIVLAKNELAKRYNIKTAETVFSAKKKCPSLVTVEPHHDMYSEYSKRVNEIYHRFTDMVEPFGIDESWLDVTASQKFFGTGLEIAEKIRRTVKEEIGITVSIGVSFNKIFAKLGSDYKKPDAITVISRDNFKEIAYPLPVGSMIFVGRKTEEALNHLGVKTIGELAAMSPAMLISRFGKMGEALHKYANGLDDAPVISEREEAKSIGNGFTFKHDLVSAEECRVGIEFLSEEIGRKLRRAGLKCATVSIAVKDEYMRVVQKQCPQNPPSDISREIAETAFKLCLEIWSPGAPVRMLTVTANNFVRREYVTEQLNMFDDGGAKEREKSKKREETIDKIRQKHGLDSVVNAAVLESDLGIFKRKD